MDNALTPREIQARIRSGASVDDVASESGMEVEHIEAFAGPVLAEREHIAAAAQTTTVRRRGEAGSHRRLGDLLTQRLRSRGIDAEGVEWDAWRQSDLKWRVSAHLKGDEEAREAEFIFDPKARLGGILRGPMLWAMLAGLLMSLFGLALPPWLGISARMLGESAIPLGLFSLGVGFASFHIDRWRIG